MRQTDPIGKGKKGRKGGRDSKSARGERADARGTAPPTSYVEMAVAAAAAGGEVATDGAPHGVRAGGGEAIAAETGLAADYGGLASNGLRPACADGGVSPRHLTVAAPSGVEAFCRRQAGGSRSRRPRASA